MKAHDKMRYECDQCDKKFISNSALKCHMMNVHIRSRPYNCRYGCNMAYNDVSNRNSHEKKKHGGLFQTDPNPNPSGMDDPFSRIFWLKFQLLFLRD